MTDEDEKMFPEENFPKGGEAAEEKPAEHETSAKEYTPWLEFVEKYPKYMSEEIPKCVTEAVQGGKNPVEAYLISRNESLEKDIQLMRAEELLRRSSVGAASSTKGEKAEDDFAAGLLYGG